MDRSSPELAPYRHRGQRRAHAYRHGARHWQKHRQRTQHGHRRRVGRHAKRSRRPVLLVAGVVVAIAIVFLVVAGLSAYRSLSSARTLLDEAHSTITTSIANEDTFETPAGRASALTALSRVSADASQADQELHSSFGLSALGVLPFLHTQRQGLLELVNNLDASATTGSTLLHQVDSLASASSGTDFDISQLRQLQTAVAVAHQQFAAFDRPSPGLWGPLGTAQRDFDREDAKITHLLSDGNRVISYALPFLGADGPRTYLIAAENNAEMRDEGSVLSYSLMHTLNGALTETTGGTVGTIDLPGLAPGVTVPTGTQAVFGALYPPGNWQSVNATADFSFSGRDMQGMFSAATRTNVDGVIGIDVVGLQELLALTGPVTVPGIPEPVSAQNASDVLLNQLYAGLPPESSQVPRREDLAEVASAAFQQLNAGKVDVVALARTFATLVAGRHLQLWDENPQYERTITAMGASGDIDTVQPTRTFHVAVENVTKTKLDYFVNVAISDTVSISPNGSAVVDTSVQLTNHAPAGQAPSYQLGPDGTNSHVAGEYVGRVLLWSPRGSAEQGGVAESGLSLAAPVDVPLMPGQSATAHFETTIPNAVKDGKLQLVFVPQPRETPDSLSVQVVGDAVQSGSTIRTTLTKTKTLTWDLSAS
jgi:hypothetical protein